MPIPFVKSTSSATARQDDPLALFEAESADRASVAPATNAKLQDPDDELPLGSFPPSETIPLESVIARKVFISWLEGVAIMEATCAALVQADGSESGAPEPSDIFLTAEGTVEVNARGHRGDSVQRLARTLHVLTSGQAIPAPTRLFISKWIAVDGKHSIAEFARELAYFARPNGRDLIRELYQRMAAEMTPARPAEPPRRKQAGPEPPKAEKPKRKAANKRQRAVLIIGAVAMVAAVAVAAGVAAYNSPQQGQGGAADIVASLMARAADFARSIGDVKTQIGQLSSQLSAHLASGESAPTAPPPSSTPNTPNRARTAARPSQASRPAAAALPPAAASSFLGAPDIAIPTLAPSAAAEALGAGAPALDEAGPAVAAPIVDPNIIYTSADEGVSPPKMLYPQLPPPALVLGPASSLNVMEITIGDGGTVERVKLVSPPRRLTDMMLLSGAKLWKFAPASKDGQPVRYRIAVSWAATIP